MTQKSKSHHIQHESNMSMNDVGYMYACSVWAPPFVAVLLPLPSFLPYLFPLPFRSLPCGSLPFLPLFAARGSGKRLSQTFSGAFRVEKCYGDVLLTLTDLMTLLISYFIFLIHCLAAVCQPFIKLLLTYLLYVGFPAG